MSNTMNRIASDLQKIMSESDKKKTSGFDTQAVVTRLDGNTAWVKFPGGEDETPVRRTTNAGVGDNVQVRVNGGRAWLIGNVTNPPTDDTKANEASYQAQNAEVHAVNAEGAAADAMKSAETARIDASIAHQMAENATQEADAAHAAATSASESAAVADTNAKQAISDAATAQTAANTAESNAQTAITNASAAQEAAATAKANAQTAITNASAAQEAAATAEANAQTAITNATNAASAASNAQADANIANSSASAALNQLGIVEDVVGTLTWLSEHAEFSLTDDTEVDESKQYYEAIWGYFSTEDTEIDRSKTYYVRSGEGTDEDPYVYTVVTSPSVAHLSEYYEYKFTGYEPVLLSEDDSPTGYYEITSIDEAVTNFIGTHLALTEQGLWVVADADNEYKVLVASDGVYIYGPSGQISKFGEDIEFSSLRPQHIGGDDTYIEFNPSTNKLNIVADDIVIGGKNALERIETFENTVPSIQDALTSQAQSIHTQQESLDILTGYVDISPTQSRIRVGDKTSTSYVEISGKSDDLRVSINIDGKDVAYMAHNRFYAPSAVVSNLYMQTELSGDNPIGAIGWVMRSNGHLSLKRIK